MADSLREYRQKRDFRKTAEPSGDTSRRTAGGYRYLIQKHAATRLHFDFRLELDGVLLSWAVPNGPSLEPEGQAPRGPHRGPPARLRRLRGHHPQGRVRRRHGHALGRGHLGAGRRSRGGAREGRLQVHPPRRAAQGKVGARPHAEEARRAVEARELAAHQGARRIRDRGVEADRRAGDQQRPHRPHHGRDRRRQRRMAQVRREHQEGRPCAGAEAKGGRAQDAQRLAAEIRRAAARDPGRCPAGGRRMGPRDQV